MRSGHLDRVCRQTLEELMTFDGCLHRGPDRETRNEGFGKCDEPGASPARLGNQRASLVDSCRRIEKYRRDVGGAHLEPRIGGCRHASLPIGGGGESTAAA